MRFLKFALMGAVSLALVIKAQCQTFGAGAPITTGSSNVLMQSSSGSYVTNPPSTYTVPPEALTVTAIANTNEILTGGYGFCMVIPGYTTNWIWTTYFTNSFALPAGTNQSGTGTWKTNFPATPIQIYPIAAAFLSTGSPTNVNNASLVP